MAIKPAPNAFRRHVWPLFLRDRWLLIGALVLNGVHGAAIAVQNLYPKWLFTEVLEAKDLTTAQRWINLSWLIGGYLAVSLVVRMAAWHAGYRMFTWVRERVVFALRGQFFRHVNHLCLRFHGEHPSEAGLALAPDHDRTQEHRRHVVDAPRLVLLDHRERQLHEGSLADQGDRPLRLHDDGGQ